jgi:hypothetical protein
MKLFNILFITAICAALIGTPILAVNNGKEKASEEQNKTWDLRDAQSNSSSSSQSCAPQDPQSAEAAATVIREISCTINSDVLGIIVDYLGESLPLKKHLRGNASWACISSPGPDDSQILTASTAVDDITTFYTLILPLMRTLLKAVPLPWLNDDGFAIREAHLRYTFNLEGDRNGVTSSITDGLHSSLDRALNGVRKLNLSYKNDWHLNALYAPENNAWLITVSAKNGAGIWETRKIEEYIWAEQEKYLNTKSYSSSDSSSSSSSSNSNETPANKQTKKQLALQAKKLHDEQDAQHDEQNTQEERRIRQAERQRLHNQPCYQRALRHLHNLSLSRISMLGIVTACALAPYGMQMEQK